MTDLSDYDFFFFFLSTLVYHIPVLPFGSKPLLRSMFLRLSTWVSFSTFSDVKSFPSRIKDIDKDIDDEKTTTLINICQFSQREKVHMQG